MNFENKKSKKINMPPIKSLLVILFVLVCNIRSFANDEEISIKIDERYEELIDTYSGNLYQSSSIHLAVIQIKKASQHFIRGLYIDANNKKHRLTDFHFYSKPTLVSHHQNKNILTFVFSCPSSFSKKENTLFILDYDLNNNTYHKKEIEDFTTPDFTLQLDYETVFVFNRGNEITFSRIQNQNHITSKNIPLNDAQKKVVKKIFATKSQFVNTKYYNKFGSIKSRRSFFYDPLLIFAYDSKEDKKVYTLTINLEVPEFLQIRAIDFSNQYHYKKHQFYIYKNMLISYAMNKNNCIIQADNLLTTNTLKYYNYNKDIDQSDSKSFKNILQEAVKSHQTPTLTVTRNAQKQLIVNLNFVNKAKYEYRYDDANSQKITKDKLKNQFLQSNLQTEGLKLVFSKRFKFDKEATANLKTNHTQEKSHLINFLDFNEISHPSATWIQKNVRTTYYDKQKQGIFVSTFENM